MSSYPPATVSVSGTNVTASYFLSKPGFVARRLRSLADLRYVGNGLLRGRADAVGGHMSQARRLALGIDKVNQKQAVFAQSVTADG